MFLWEYCSHSDHVNDPLYIFNLDIISHSVTPESFFVSLYIPLVNSTICDDIQKGVCVCVSVWVCEEKYFLICSNEGERLVALLTDVINRYCVMADSVLVKVCGQDNTICPNVLI